MAVYVRFQLLHRLLHQPDQSTAFLQTVRWFNCTCFCLQVNTVILGLVIREIIKIQTNGISSSSKFDLVKWVLIWFFTPSKFFTPSWTGMVMWNLSLDYQSTTWCWDHVDFGVLFFTDLVSNRQSFYFRYWVLRGYLESWHWTGKQLHFSTFLLFLIHYKDSSFSYFTAYLTQRWGV